MNEEVFEEISDYDRIRAAQMLRRAWIGFAAVRNEAAQSLGESDTRALLISFASRGSARGVKAERLLENDSLDTLGIESDEEVCEQYQTPIQFMEDKRYLEGFLLGLTGKAWNVRVDVGSHEFIAIGSGPTLRSKTREDAIVDWRYRLQESGHAK